MTTKPLLFGILALLGVSVALAEEGSNIDASTLEGRVMCGYQAWFRCPGDVFDFGWYHWSRNPNEINPNTLTFELWSDVSFYPKSELFAAPGFTHPDGSQAYLFSSDSPVIIKRHFELLRDYGIDGVWLQRFVVGLPGTGTLPEDFVQKYAVSHQRITDHVRKSAVETKMLRGEIPFSKTIPFPIDANAKQSPQL